MCLKLSMAMRGKSFSFFPRWCRGWANFLPSAVKKFMLSGNTKNQRVTDKRDQLLRFSDSKSVCTISVNLLMLSLSSGEWNRIRNGSPSSVSSSAFSKVISRTRGTHFSDTQMCSSSKFFKLPV
jgi:hypothetical protein